jgi:uncharacterized protein (DUF362 family)
MSDADHDGRVSRRGFLFGAGTGLAAGGLLGWGITDLAFRLRGQGQASRTHPVLPVPSDSSPEPLYVRKRFTGTAVEDPNPAFPLPGRWPGKVVEVHHPGSVVEGEIQLEPVRQMVARGMRELTGAPSAEEAWRALFQKGDRVAIKVNPVGRSRRPGEVASVSNFATVLAIVEGLRSAGLGVKDIVLYERYADEFRAAGYEVFLQRELPGVGWYAAAVKYDDRQTDLDGRDPNPKTGVRPDPDPHVLGYDPDVFRKLDYASPWHNPNDPLSYESHVARIITGDFVNKLIMVPVLKDHRSGGITLALKNMSHGLVSNVARSHPAPGNTCGTFIPKMVALEPIRRKVVLQILDGLIGCYEGGPGTWNASWATWEARSLFFATDPVALDHVGMDVLDAERAARGWPPVARMGLDGNNRSGGEQFTMRQPEHVELSGFLELGLFDPARIEYRRVELV